MNAEVRRQEKTWDASGEKFRRISVVLDREGGAPDVYAFRTVGGPDSRRVTPDDEWGRDPTPEVVDALTDAGYTVVWPERESPIPA